MGETKDPRPRAALTALGESEHSTVTIGGTGAPSGWDPYDVWRTRILLPRLAHNDRPALSAVEQLDVIVRAPSTVPGVANGAVSLGEDALRREMLNAISFLFAAGLVGAFLIHSDQVPLTAKS